MARGYWLMKSEPFKYSWEDLVKDGQTYWDGVRNYEARNNLAAMKNGDLALYYHSNEGKEDVAPVVPFTEPVTLATIKADPALPEIQLVKRGRLSVVPLTSEEFRYVAKLGKTKVPKIADSVAAKRFGKGARK